MEKKNIVYAGLWRRLQAWMIDLILVVLTSCFIALVAAIFLSLTVGLFLSDRELVNQIYKYSGAVIGFLTFITYFVGFEISNLEATPGKAFLNMKITDMKGNRIGVFRSLARLFSKVLSGFLLGLGFVICDFTAQKQALHDIIADTLVVIKSQELSEPPVSNSED